MDTTARLLRLLDLLQSRAVWTGPALADRLGVTERTVRRDVDRVRQLGYPVEAERGAAGGYRLTGGRAMPPLVLAEDEAVAVAVALRLGVGSVAGSGEAGLRALAKLDQVLPARLRPQVAAVVDATTTTTAGVAASEEVPHDVLVTTARATRDGVRLRFAYRRRDGEDSRRTVDPLRLVATGRRWYLVAFDHDRDDWRAFRLDRMTDPRPSTLPVTQRDGPDPAEFVLAGMRSGGYRVVARVGLSAPVESVRRRLPPSVARVDEDGAGGSLVEAAADDAELIARHLVMAALDLGADLVVHEPDEVRHAVTDLAATVSRWG